MEEILNEDGRENLKPILEALFLAAEAPLPVPKICEILGEFKREEVVRALRDLVREYDERRGGFSLHEVAGGFQFRTNPEHAAWIRKLKGGRPVSLTSATMEILAIVAYRQPVVRAEIDRIRGVDSSGPLRGLLDKKLIRMLGRKDVPGKPILYGTTKKFLETFDLKDLSELPTLSELKELAESSPESGVPSPEFDEEEQAQGVEIQHPDESSVLMTDSPETELQGSEPADAPDFQNRSEESKGIQSSVQNNMEDQDADLINNEKHEAES
ncbi:MAG TPA: SMC-Scp complex subunit ScpB [Syntrophales bacterium]|nr:SMC-Scp complex subunit ScpB [Syntrophales bacterium]